LDRSWFLGYENVTKVFTGAAFKGSNHMRSPVKASDDAVVPSEQVSDFMNHRLRGYRRKAFSLREDDDFEENLPYEAGNKAGLRSEEPRHKAWVGEKLGDERARGVVDLF
jgi:hypothetical protein